jgi:membrane protein YqaA with SNARE-associated domain
MTILTITFKYIMLNVKNMKHVRDTRIGKAVSGARDRLTRTHRRIVEYSIKHSLGLGFWIFMLLIFILGVLFFTNIKLFVNWIVSDYGYLGIFVMSIITDLLVQPVGPDVPLIAGVLGGLNPWIVLIAVLIGAYVALIIAYYMGKKIGAPGIERIIGRKNFQKVYSYQLGGKWFMFIGALTPVPYIPYLAGLWRFSFKDTMIYVVFPRTLRFIIVFILTYYLGIVLFK